MGGRWEAPAGIILSKRKKSTRESAQISGSALAPDVARRDAAPARRDAAAARCRAAPYRVPRFAGGIVLALEPERLSMLK